jgi:hypothetical protein
MTIPASDLRETIRRLHSYMLQAHWNGRAIAGPDAGVRLSSRLGRFIKSYLDFLPWSDNYVFLQAQGYWILANWLIADLLDNAQCRELALACSHFVIAVQQPGGYWEYPPIPSRKGKIATVEGNIATLGLLEGYRRTQQEPLLDAAKKWHKFLIQNIGFQHNGNQRAVNYWVNSSSAIVPNNTTLTLWLLAKLAEATNDERYLAPCRAMVTFLRHVQTERGELPYAVPGTKARGRPHFLCFQYNAFEFLDLVHYYRITEDQEVWPILEKLAIFLSTGLSDSGAARYDCFHTRPEVSYYTAAAAAALSQATVLGLGNFGLLAEQAYRRVVSQQRIAGGEFFSRGNYGLLTDRRSYPRNLVMILYHLLLEVQTHALRSTDGQSG